MPRAPLQSFCHFFCNRGHCSYTEPTWFYLVTVEQAHCTEVTYLSQERALHLRVLTVISGGFLVCVMTVCRLGLGGLAILQSSSADCSREELPQCVSTLKWMKKKTNQSEWLQRERRVNTLSKPDLLCSCPHMR